MNIRALTKPCPSHGGRKTRESAVHFQNLSRPKNAVLSDVAFKFTAS
jgi:hypothetical protein